MIPSQYHLPQFDNIAKSTTTKENVCTAGGSAHRAIPELGRLFRYKSRLFQQSQDAASRAASV